jgi:hypothetical protein
LLQCSCPPHLIALQPLQTPGHTITLNLTFFPRIALLLPLSTSFRNQLSVAVSRTICLLDYTLLPYCRDTSCKRHLSPSACRNNSDLLAIDTLLYHLILGRPFPSRHSQPGPHLLHPHFLPFLLISPTTWPPPRQTSHGKRTHGNALGDSSVESVFR